jgi:hypothetical protein
MAPDDNLVAHMSAGVMRRVDNLEVVVGLKLCFVVGQNRNTVLDTADDDRVGVGRDRLESGDG